MNIDDCWPEMERDSNDQLVADKSRFPSGMKELASYVHSKGLKLGTYNDMGTKTCGGYPGECKDQNCTLPGYMSIDAKTYASWGIVSLSADFHMHAHLIYKCTGFVEDGRMLLDPHRGNSESGVRISGC